MGRKNNGAVLVEPRFLPELRRECPGLRFAAVFLVRENAESLVDALRYHSDPQDWVGKHVRQEITYHRIAEMVCAYSRLFREQAEEYGFPLYEMDSNFDQRVDEMVAVLQEMAKGDQLLPG